jgi:hypothetical protein
MGCNGSKTAQAGTPVAAKAASPTQIPEGDFKINLENATGSESLGAFCQFPDSKYILVERVKEEGLIPSWNKGCENTPEMQVQAWDCIVVVNGVFGNTELMKAELKSKAITLTVKSGQPATGEVADVPSVAVPAVGALDEHPAAVVPAQVALAAEAPAAAALAEEQAAEAAAPVSSADAPAVEVPADASAAEVPVTEPPPSGGPATESPASKAPVDRSTFNGAPERVFSVQSAEKGTSAEEEQLCNMKWC